MKKLSENQKRRIRELKERNEAIDKLVVPKIEDHIQPLPLNLIIEANFNATMRKGIELEGEIAFLKERSDPNDASTLAIKQTRLERVKGRLEALSSVGDMLKFYSEMGRVFDVIPK